MLKVGFIDYYLDEWHANHYPQYIKEASGGKYEVSFAYGKIDSPIGGMTNKEWSEKYGIPLLNSIEEVVEKSDRIIVLSPDNPEMHEELCRIPLASGKLVYVDKTFAPDRQAAERIAAHAEKHHTKWFSSSALRFSTELKEIDKASVHRIYSEGPGTYDMYSIHQIEPIVCLMESRAKEVMFIGEKDHPSMLIRFEDGRIAEMHQSGGLPFRIVADNAENKSKVCEIQSDYFMLFIEALVQFFDTGIVPVPNTQTIDVIAIREAGIKAMQTPFCWTKV